MQDWGQVSEMFDEVLETAKDKVLEDANEAETRFTVIDKLIKDIFQWDEKSINLEVHTNTSDNRNGFIDYFLKTSNTRILIEAKRIGSSFPTVTKKRIQKIDGAYLSNNEIKDAITQVRSYAGSKNAKFCVVTNGSVWCIFKTISDNINEDYAELYFPLSNNKDAVDLFNLLAFDNVYNGSLNSICKSEKVTNYKKLSNVIKIESRLGRNNISDLLMHEIDSALISENINNSKSILAKLYVANDTRKRFDSTLNSYLKEYKPNLDDKFHKLKRGRNKDKLTKLITNSPTQYSPPVTLLLGSVGTGKTTYLKHFELVTNSRLIEDESVNWIYLDFERIGTNNPRSFLYSNLREYIDKISKFENPYLELIKPAYKEYFDGQKKGVNYEISKDEDKWREFVRGKINRDYENTIEYVEKILTYLAKIQTCVIVLDNVDLSEDEVQEKAVFSESIALSKKIKCQILVSLRETTYIKYRNTPTFNAHELKVLWINPPEFKSVLKKRLTYAEYLLKDKKIEVDSDNDITFQVNDASQFLRGVHNSLLQGENLKFIESMSYMSPRAGLELVRNFISSNHIRADYAIKKYMEINSRYIFPFQEVFKGSLLGQYKYYKERDTHLLNLFDSKHHRIELKLLRLYLLRKFFINSKFENPEISINELNEYFSSLSLPIGVVENTCEILLRFKLINTNNKHEEDTKYYITEKGLYYHEVLLFEIVYFDTIIFDSPINNLEVFNKIYEETIYLESNRSSLNKMKKRKTRMNKFLKECIIHEEDLLIDDKYQELKCLKAVLKALNEKYDEYISRIKMRTKKNRPNFRSV